MSNPTKFVGYVRCSTEGQVTDGLSLEYQQAGIRRWALEHGAEEIAMLEDAGVSGGSQKGRPGLAAALNLVEEHGAALVVYSLSRMARSTQDTANIAKRIDRAGGNLVSLTEQIDTTNATGKMIFRMLAVLAEFERDLVSDRTKAALRQKRAKGERISCRTPFGFILLPDQKTLVENPAEQSALSAMRAWRAAGRSYRDICKELKTAGIKTSLGSPDWEPTTVRRLLGRVS